MKNTFDFNALLHSQLSRFKMGDRSAYLAPGGYTAGNTTPGGYTSSSTGGNKGNYSYSREEYAWNTPTGSGGGNTNQVPQQLKANVTKPKTDVSCYLAPK